MSTGPATVTVVVPTWRRAEWLKGNLASLREQTRQPDELIVVGRAEDTDARAVVDAAVAESKFPVRWAEVDRPGHVAPVICGLGAATSELVAFLDDDVEARPDWLERSTEIFDLPDVAVAGCRIVDPTIPFRRGVPKDAGVLRWYGRHAGNIASRITDGPVDVDGVQEASWMWRADVLRSLEFDPILDFDDASMYGLDLCLQARARGLRVVYDSRPEVVDLPAPRDADLDRDDRPPRIRSYCRNFTYIVLKHRHGWRRLAFVVWWWGVGERGSYGVAKAVADTLMGRWSTVRVQWSAARRGRREGLRAYRNRVRVGKQG